MARPRPATHPVRSAIALVVTASAMATVPATAAGGDPQVAAAGLVVQSIRWDPPTPTTLGVQVLISGDDDHDGSVLVRYRVSGSGAAWQSALPLLRVRPETVHRSGGDPPPQFAGSIFQLQPATTYEVDLDIRDPDGDPADQPPLTASTAGLPVAPTTVRPVSPSTLARELTQVQAGTVLLLAAGQYTGPFTLRRSGLAGRPIVLRGAGRDTTELVGTSGSSVLDVHGDYVHVENLTIRTGRRGIRFMPTTDAAGIVHPRVGGVVQGTRIHGTDWGITALATDGTVTDDFTGSFICNNVLEGKVPQEQYYGDGNNGNANFHGVQVGGGSVVCNNTLSGYGDAIEVFGKNTRAVDIYGNDVRWAYDNAVETDGSEGNVRVYGNRFLNAYSPLSFQPVYGGPVYAFRNVAVNAINEVVKFHGIGGTQTNSNGVLVYHNTFVKPDVPLIVYTPARSANFTLQNNLFIGGDGAVRAVDWTAPFELATFDYNGYYPDQPFRLGGVRYTSLVNLQDLTDLETNGRIVPRDVLATLRPWPGWIPQAPPTVDAGLGASSPARNRGLPLPNVNDVPDGAPDLGALEYGCPSPQYGVRADGSTAPPRCTSPNAVSWVAQQNTQADDGTLRKSAGGANAQDAGAISAQLVGPGQPYNAVEFGWPALSTSGCVGLNTANPGTSCSEVRYRLVLQPYSGGALATAYDNATWCGDALFGSSDRLRIATVDGVVTFARNGVRFAACATAPPAQQQVDTSLWNIGATVSSARLVRVATGANA